MALAKPRAILILGNYTARTLIDPNGSIHALRGRWFDLKAGSAMVPAIATFHPTDLIQAPLNKGLAWRDLLMFRMAIAALWPLDCDNFAKLMPIFWPQSCAKCMADRLIAALHNCCCAAILSVSWEESPGTRTMSKTFRPTHCGFETLRQAACRARTVCSRRPFATNEQLTAQGYDRIRFGLGMALTGRLS